MLKGSKKDKEKYYNLTKEVLEELYINQELSTTQLQKKLGIHRDTITSYMKKFDITRRDCGKMGAKASIKYNIVDENFFNKIDTEDKAYILGFILGDGTISKKGIHIALAKQDTQILNEIAIRLKAEKYFNIKKSNPSTNEQDKIHLPLRRKQFAIDLNKHGIPYPPKSFNEPFIILDNDILQWHFIRGMFDADGCIRVYERNGYKKYKFSITAGQSFCNGIKSFFENWFDVILPLKSSHIKSGSNVWVFELASKDLINLIGKCMYLNSTIHLNRKKEKFDQI